MDIFKSLGDLATNAGKIVAAPVEIAADVTNNLIVKPVADVADDCVEAVKEMTEDDE